MKKILGILTVMLTLTCGIVYAGVCDDLVSQNDKYGGTESGEAALARARVCVIQYLSATLAVMDQQEWIDEELKKAPESLALLRLKAKTLQERVRLKNLIKKVEEKAIAIRRDIERGLIQPPDKRRKQAPQISV